RIRYCLAPTQLLQYRLECRIAEKFPLVIGHHADAVHLERVERVLDLAQGSLNVRKRHGREHPESARMVGDKFGAELIGFAGELSRGVEITKEHTGLANRQYRSYHPALIHIFDRLRHRPFHQRYLAGSPTRDFSDESR